MRRLSVLALAAALWVQGCFYDSRWGEAKRVQQHNAAAASPATLHVASADGAERAPARVYRVRVYATTSYAAQTMDWKRKMTDLVDDANRVLERAVGARLQVESCRDWGAVREDDLAATLASLRTSDSGRDVDWVVGMAGGLPRVTRSFHDVGMADLGGKHFVLRAAAELEDETAIARNFDELKEEERAELVRARKRHRAVAVFLHEIGHTLGAPHTRDARSLMSPQYDSRMEAYGDASTALMRATLAHRDDVDAGPRTAAAATLQPEKPLPEDVSPLPEGERDRYARAIHAFEASDVAGAYEAAGPLFESRADVYSIQDLRCKLALARGLVWTETRAECDALMKLSTSKKAATPGKKPSE